MRLTFFSAALLFVASLAAAPLQVEVKARQAILMNAETGAILYEKQAHSPAYPASITKIATAVFALDRKRAEMERLVQVSGECLKMKPATRETEEGVPSYWLEADGTKMG